MQPIDKDKIVAEIKRLKESFINERDAFEKGYHHGLDMVLYFLDTLETKEVDLEEAVDDAKDLAMRDMAWNVHVMISEGKSIGEIDYYVCGICDF